MSFEELKQKVKGKIELIPADLSFDAFWNAYDKKVSKKRCQSVWAKMSDAKRMACLMNISSYDSFLKRSTRGKLDPENYLKREAYETNWNQIKN